MKGLVLLAKCPVCGATELHECGKDQFVCESCGSRSWKRELEFTSTACSANLPEGEINEPSIYGSLSVNEAISNVTKRFYYE